MITDYPNMIRFMMANYKRATHLADDLLNAGYDVMQIFIYRRYYATIDICTANLTNAQIDSLKLFLKNYSDEDSRMYSKVDP